MQGKADMLVAKRTLSALIVVCVVMSAFAGLMFLAQPLPTRAQALGDLTISSGTYTIENIDQPIDGNVNVSGTGQLIVRDGSLSIISNYDPGQRHAINVRGGGTLTLEHGTITTYLDQIDPWPFLTLTIDTGGHLVATEGSLLMFPGNININSGATVSLTDTTVTKLPSSEVSKYVVGTGGLITLDSADDGPAISVSSSTLQLFDSTLDALPEYPTEMLAASNLTLSGSSTLLAVNSFIGVDFGPAVFASDWYTHNVLVLTGTSTANLYGTSFETYSGAEADRAPAVTTSGESMVATPATKGAEDTTGQSITALLASGEGSTYHVGPGLVMAIDSFNAGPAMAIDGATLVVRYKVDPGYNGARSFTWSTNEGGTTTSTGITPLASETNWVEKSYDLHAGGVVSSATVSTIDINFQHNGGAGDVQVDSMSIIMSVGSQAYVYRWLNVTVGDEYGVPIPGSSISSLFTGSTSYGGQPAFYFWSGSVHSAPPSEVLSYMGKSSTTFRTTGANGIASIPYLTDIISGNQAPNSLYVGGFEITGSATISSVVYESTETFAFPAYPSMTRPEQSFDVTVELSGVSAPSPDQSRWLVVPVSPTQDSLTIEHMSYYHAGDVIVAADGFLTLNDTEFQIVQTSAYQRTIYVDGTSGHSGRLLLQNSMIMSGLPLSIIVKGTGIFEAIDTQLIGVNIIAEGNSQVILSNVSMDGTLTTSWNSNSVISVSDSDLANAPVLSGNSRGGFTNTSVPSIVVEDNAYAQIFRWILTWVYDGAGQPLENATVEARYYINNSLAASAKSDRAGVAKVNSLGTNITSSGSTFVGNYKVNATYTYGGHVYNATQNVSVGVMPYTEPLGRNASYVTMVIPDAMPDLAIHDTPVPITVSPANPLRGNLTEVSAVVNNDGVSGAYNVQVNFYDSEYGTYTGGLPNTADLFAIATIPYIAPGGSEVATAPWTADYPLDPDQHLLIAVADPESKLTELNESWAQQSYALPFTVRTQADLEVRYYSISLGTPEIDKTMDISAIVYNNGDADAVAVLVNFYDGNMTAGNEIGSVVLSGVARGSSSVASITHAFPTLGQHRIWVWADPLDAINESIEVNNFYYKDITVYPHPDLQLSGLVFVLPDGTEVPDANADQVLNFTVVLRNLGDAPVAYPVITMWINASHSGPEMHTITVSGTVAGPYNSRFVKYEYTVPRLDYQETVEVTMIVNWNRATIETDYSNNIQTNTFTIRDDRPDLSVAIADIHVKRANQDIQSETYGSSVFVVTTVKNLGGREATFKMKINVSQGAYNYSIPTAAAYNISANTTDDTKEISVPWIISQTVQGQYSIWVWLDPTNEVSETNESNNLVAKPFTISQLHVKVTAIADNTEYKAGKTMVITATITYETTGLAVKDLPGVTFYLMDRNNNPIQASTTDPKTTNQDGMISVTLPIPLNLDTGPYTVGASVAGLEYASATTVQISSSVQGGLFPMWVWIVIIIAVVAVVAGFTLYTYVYGLGKLVECGECGAFIPAASKRCPKCGVEFEAGTMKCSECGAWIPADSTECPNCGVKFLGEVEDEADYMERMRKEYDEMVSKYRELAKTELGKKFSDREFEDWWRTQPGYITFDDWLAKEEEKKKEGPVPCPVCGTLNPKEATVCHKCGTVFAGATTPVPGKGPPPAGPATVMPAPLQPEGAAQQQPPGAAPRMVIRRPIDRKVVPKKIIKTPLGGEEKAENGDETENQ